MNRSAVLWFVLTLVLSSNPNVYCAGPFASSIVRVTVTRYRPNVVQPWTKASAEEAAATGFLIENNRVLTNAHVVDFADQIYLQPYNSSEKIEAKVVVSAPEIDLAVLSVEDESFFENRPAIPLYEGLPKAQSPVQVYGYPAGSDHMSVTEGVISRLNFAATRTGSALLQVQIDAALNPGNSGGPAISEGKLVGVAFQAVQSAENVGLLVSSEEVRLFLADVEDGNYDGKFQLFADVQSVENEALRSKMALPEGAGGALVNELLGYGSEHPLRAGDVITHVAESPLDRTGMVKVSDELRLPFQYLINRTAQDSKVNLKVLRGGQQLDLEIPTDGCEPRVVPSLKGTYPRYFILGPLVFSAATVEFVAGIGPQWTGVLLSRQNPILTRLLDQPRFAGEELVVIASPMFTHKITKGYAQPFGMVVARIDDTPVKNLRHLVELLRDGSGEFLKIEFADRYVEKLVFRRAEIMSVTEDILANNGIRKQYSDEFATVWESQ